MEASAPGKGWSQMRGWTARLEQRGGKTNSLGKYTGVCVAFAFPLPKLLLHIKVDEKI